MPALRSHDAALFSSSLHTKQIPVLKQRWVIRHCTAQPLMVGLHALRCSPSCDCWAWDLLTVQQELIRIGASRELDVFDKNGFTPLALAIHFNHPDCAELLLDGGAKMANLHKCTKIPGWMDDITKKGRNVKQSLWAFIGLLRKRFKVVDGTTEHLGDRIPRDVVTLLSGCFWKTRFNPQWIHPGKPPNDNKKDIRCVLM